MGHAFLSALLSFGAIGVAYADDSEEAINKPSAPIEPPPTYVDVAKKERARIEELIKSKGARTGSYPRFNVAVRGQKITLKFQVPSTCEVAQLIANTGSQLGVKVSDQSGGSDMVSRAWDNPVAWQVTLRSVANKKEPGASEEDADEDLCIPTFGSLITSDKAEVEFIKKGSLTTEEFEAFVSALQVAGTKAGENKGAIGVNGSREPSNSWG